LPDNFLITWETNYGYVTTLCRKDGSWYYGTQNKESEYKPETIYHSAAILQSDSSFVYYDWYSYDKSVGEPTSRFTGSYETVDEALENILDFDGFSENGNPSSWLQMSKDFADSKQFGGAQMRMVIGSSLTKTGTEVIAGITCDVAHADMMFSLQDIAYDPETGILFRYRYVNKGGSGDDDKEPYTYTVTEYTANPSTLGAYVE
jgi:hypothetical protein